MDLIGKTLGQYQVVEQIGQGGMATVFKAYQPALDRHVAIKVLPAQHALRPGFSERFVREARAVARLDHPNILPIMDFGQEEDLSYIVMKLVTGGTLRERLGQPLDLTRTLHLAEQIAAALDHAHGRGLLHRDVKPSNVLLDEEDWVQLADFGLAKMVAEDSGLTLSGASIGTPAYTSPEQGQGLEVDHRTDVYALGVMLYEMVTGRLPFWAKTSMAIVLMHITEPPPMPRQINAALSLAVEDVILKALAKEPDARYASAGEMVRALQEAVVGPTGAMPVIAPHEPLAAFPPAPTAPAPKTVDISPQPIFPSDTAKEFAGAFPPKSELTSPPEPTRPPQAAEFVGRETELAYYADKLVARQPAVIAGMAGVGKTALALALARQVVPLDDIFWHSFHEGEGVDALLWKLAGFLAWRGQEDVWRMLQGAQGSGGQPPPTPVLFDYLFQTLRRRGYLLCLDDFQFVDDDPLLNQLVERLCEAVEAGELSLIITSRRLPDFVSATEYETLAGLSAADTGRLLAAREVSLTENLAAELYTRTEGNVELLTLAFEALKQAGNPGRLIARLAEADDIERYLMHEVDESLGEEEREVMSAVASLLGYPGTRDAIETVLDSGSVRRALSDLGQRHLLSVGQGEWGKEYGQHALVRVFYYDLLGRRERRDMHCRAGEFYETEEPDALKAARHYEWGGEHERAAQLATSEVWALINQGQARALSLLLEQFTARKLPPQLWAAVNVVRGEIGTLQRETQLAQDSYQEALAGLDTLPDSPQVRELYARACRGMGDLLRDQSPDEALDWLRRGLDKLAETNPQEQAALYLKMSTAQMYMGDFEAALSAVQKGQSLLPPGPHWLGVGALVNQGMIYANQGDPQRASEVLTRALEMSRQLNNHYQTLVILNNLGVCLMMSGDWSGTVDTYRQGLDIAEQLGSLVYQVLLGNNLGLIRARQGDYDSAWQHFSSSLHLARSNDLSRYQISSHVGLADLHLRQGEAEAATPLLDEAERLALEIKARGKLPDIYAGQARLRLAQEEAQAARDDAERAVNVARELGMDFEEGVSLRVLGRALLAAGQFEPALETFERSLAILVSQDPYEAARTQAAWGAALIAGENVEQGTSLLQEAQATFTDLGAKRDLAAVEQALRGI
jgi:serine/threonine protein kinase/tetratricopeptide (TPR) repeat protein